MEDKVYGTISGITPGERSLTVEEDFIKAISAVLALVLSRGKLTGAAPEDIVKARAEAVVETAVTINHEVNNPLTAVLGNIQLLLLNADEFSPDIMEKLKAVETSALKIKEVTQNLMRIIEPSVIEYTTGLKMVDLQRSLMKSEDDERKEKEKEKDK
jgi:K+-sensing histidine kinase KdpD